MTYGGRGVAFWGAALVVWMAAPATCAPAQTGTLLRLDDKAVQVTLADGSLLTADIRPSSLFLKGGLMVSLTDFLPGDAMAFRVRARAGGVSLVLLGDLDSLAAIDAARGKILRGMLQSASDHFLVLLPDGSGALPLTLRVSAKTRYLWGGQDAAASAFAPGATVAVQTRGLPDGLLLAETVSDASGPAPTRTAHPSSRLSGIVWDLPLGNATLVLMSRSKTRRVIAVNSSTRITLDGNATNLSDFRRGMSVSSHLGRDKDADGNPIAVTLTAHSAAPLKTKKKAR